MQRDRHGVLAEDDINPGFRLHITSWGVRKLKGKSGSRNTQDRLSEAADLAVENSPLLGVSGKWHLRPSEKWKNC